MKTISALALLAAGVIAGASGHYLYAESPFGLAAILSGWPANAPAAERKVLYYRDPDGAPYWSAVPKENAAGRQYLPVFDDEEPLFDPSAQKMPAVATAPNSERKILYYRNPMGMSDTSQVPKKDSMGMDYVPVYADEQDEPGTVTVSLDKIQRTGVRTEKVETRPITQSVRAVGTIQRDESLLWTVTVRSDGYVEKLFVNKTGEAVRAGEPLFRFYSSEIQIAQADLMIAVRAESRAPRADANQDLQGAMQKLRNLDVPETRIDEVRRTMTNPRTIDWPAPATGDVIEKRVIEGQRVQAGDELFRIADHSRVWVIADVAEADMAAVKLGMRADVTLRAFPTAPHQGAVTFVYPEMLNPETRTISVRIELPNPDGQLKPGMYADVVLHPEAGEAVTAVPESAVIDSGSRQVILVARGEGRFQPRTVKLGARGGGYVAILDGVKPGEEVVTSANFLIDSESNLKAALQAFSGAGGPS